MVILESFLDFYWKKKDLTFYYIYYLVDIQKRDINKLNDDSARKLFKVLGDQLFKGANRS